MQPGAQAKHLISILVPVYNEERNIRLLYEAVAQLFLELDHRYDLELLFTDNGKYTVD